MSRQDTAGEGPSRAGRVAEIQRWLSRTADLFSGSTVPLQNYDPDTHDHLLTYGGLRGYEEIERYWVNAPFAFVSINYTHEDDKHLYYVVEPDLNDLEADLLERLLTDVREPLLYRDDVAENPEAALKEELKARLEEYGVEITVEAYYRLYYYLYRRFHGYAKIDPVMHDPGVEDISCDGPGHPIFVYHEEYTDVETNVTFERRVLNDFVIQLAQRSGRHVSVSDPVASTTLPDGSRVELALGEEVTPRGSAFTIRKYADEPFTPMCSG